jgi:hypothetical protein
MDEYVPACAAFSSEIRGMNGRVLVLGAAGRLGLAAEAVGAARWQVVSFVRRGAGRRAPPSTGVIESDDTAAVAAAAHGADVLPHALNTPYP